MSEHNPRLGNQSEEMDEYLRTHPYLDVATTDMQRLVMWMSKQPEKNVLLAWLSGAMEEATKDYERGT